MTTDPITWPTDPQIIHQGNPLAPVAARLVVDGVPGEATIAPVGKSLAVQVGAVKPVTEPPEPEPPTDPSKPDWWPGSNKPDILLGSAAAEWARDQLDGKGGFLTLTTPGAVSAFARLMTAGGGMRGKPESRIVIRCSPGLNFDESMKNVKGEWSDLCFDGITFVPDGHQDDICLAPHGGHKRVQFLNCHFRHWKQVIEGQKDGAGNQPDAFEFIGGSWAAIYNSKSPITTSDNQNEKGHRSQGAWWRGDGWRFVDVEMLGIGWDMTGDPQRKKCDKYSQALYGSQNATNTDIIGCVIDGVANNAIVYKGTGHSIAGNFFNRCVNFISLGTNENPQHSCKGVIVDNDFGDLIPLGPKDNPDLPKSEQVEMDSGIAISFNNTDGVIVSKNAVTGQSTGRRKVFAYFNNGKSSSVSAKGTLIYGNDTGGLSLAEVRNFRVPASGFDVTADNNVTPEDRILVRNTDPTNAGTVLANFKVNGKTAVAL